MKLLTGPAGSGKTHAILERVRELLQSRSTGFRLLVPTATMAEHLRNLLARQGFVFSPHLVQTFSKFVCSKVGAFGDPPAGALELAIRSALAVHTPEPFATVSRTAGFERVLATLMRDCSSAGYAASDLAEADAVHPYLNAFTGLYQHVEQTLAARDWRLRGAVLDEAACQIGAHGLAGIREVLLDGFFQFTAPELGVIAAISRYAGLTVTLPDWTGASYCRSVLLDQGFVETRLEANPRNPEVTVLEAPAVSAEAEAIAVRILAAIDQEHTFRDIGVVVRGDNAYIPALRTTLARFGIPAAFLFGEPLAAHVCIRFLMSLIKAMLGGWDWAETLSALRLAPSGLSGTRMGDQFDFALRKLLPGRGLATLEALPGGGELGARLREMETQFTGTAVSSEWARRCSRLRRLISLPASFETGSHSLVLLWRSIPAALEAFERVLAGTAMALGDRPAMPFASYWEQLQFALEQETLRVPDRRRDTVHVMDVYEARQWALPVIFVCGLIEKEFPRHYQQNPILPDEIRHRLQGMGIRLRTAADYQVEEDFLFDFAVTRATERLFLSYPRYNPAGAENLRSFLLDSYIQRRQLPVESATGARPGPRNFPQTAGIPSVEDPQLRSHLALQHRRLSPTSIETYLQCPFRFFAADSLQLQGAPAPPEERLDIPSQGNIMHGVLADWVRHPRPWRGLFESHWDIACHKLRVKPGYHAESIRLELIRNLEMLIPKLEAFSGGRSEVERDFTLHLPDALTVRGKIDRLIHRPDGTVLILDYKYTRPEKVRQLMIAHEAGLMVQGGLYLIAVEECFRLPPAGFLYCSVKKELAFYGWHTQSGLTLTQACEPQHLRQVMEQARSQALEVYHQIGNGRIVPRPADPDKCRSCEFAAICRKETVQIAITAGQESL
ncbi:MAG: PD-(D/E)XK nuclease family protein [Bryobacterales bacterium]|nr:PD-(D/E)XK nuclease family protein [Bryobacterales bacterium]